MTRGSILEYVEAIRGRYLSVSRTAISPPYGRYEDE